MFHGFGQTLHGFGQILIPTPPKFINSQHEIVRFHGFSIVQNRVEIATNVVAITIYNTVFKLN